MRAGLALLLLAGCPKQAQTAASAPTVPTVTSFAWPDGATAVRSAERFTNRSVADQEQQMLLRTTEKLTVHKGDAGWQLRSEEGRFLSIDGGDPDPALAALAAVPVDVRVDGNGDFVEMSDPDGWAEEAKHAMYEVLPEGDAMAFVRVDMAVQPLQMEATLLREWTAVVGLWKGKSTAAGSLGSVQGTDALGAPSETTVVLESGGPTPCVDGGPPVCVLFVATSEPPAGRNEQRAAPLLRAWVDALPERPEASGVDALVGVVSSQVVLDPATMLPWRLTTSDRLDGTLRVGADSMPFVSEHGKTVTWAWTVPAL